MGLRFRKSVNFGPLRVNFSKSGVGYSVGGKGFRVTKKAGGGTRTTASIPGTGISYVKDYSDSKSKKSAAPVSSGGKTSSGSKKPKKWPYIVGALLILGAIGSVLPDKDEPAASSSGISSSASISSISSSASTSAPDTSLPVAMISVPSSEDSSTSSNVSVPVDQSPDVSTSEPATAQPDPSENSSTPTQDPDPTTEPDPTPVPTPVPTPTPDPEPTSTPETNSKTVYVTPTGKKYHYDNNCNGGTYIESTLDKALSMGLTPCKKCAGG